MTLISGLDFRQNTPFQPYLGWLHNGGHSGSGPQRNSEGTLRGTTTVFESLRKARDEEYSPRWVGLTDRSRKKEKSEE